MEILEFLEIFFKRDDTSISCHTYHGWVWYEWYKYAELTELINFDCQFDEKGACKHHRRFQTSNQIKIRCCCKNCRRSIGFLSTLPSDIKVLKYIASVFDNKTGFWKEGTGCILPRKYRSPTCLTYICHLVRLDLCKLKDDSRILIEDVLEILNTKNPNISNIKPTNYRSNRIVKGKIDFGKYKRLPSAEDLELKLKKVDYGL